MLQVGIDGDDRVPAGGLETRQQCGFLAEVAAESQPLDARVLPGKLPDALEGIVTTAIIDDDELELHSAGSQCVQNDRGRVRDATGLVVRRDHHTQQLGSIHIHRRLNVRATAERCRIEPRVDRP